MTLTSVIYFTKTVLPSMQVFVPDKAIQPSLILYTRSGAYQRVEHVKVLHSVCAFRLRRGRKKFYGIGTRMMGRKTVARLSSFLLISPMLVELISFGLFRLAFPLGLGLLWRKGFKAILRWNYGETRYVRVTGRERVEWLFTETPFHRSGFSPNVLFTERMAIHLWDCSPNI